MKKSVLFSVIMCTFLLFGCANDNGINEDELNIRLEKMEQDIVDLNAEKIELNKRISTLKNNYDTKLHKLEEDVEYTIDIVDEVKFNSTPAYVSVYEDGYDVAQTDVGPLLIYVDGVTEYLNGYKVKLVIGNTNNVTLNGAELDIKCRKSLFEPVEKEFSTKISEKIYAGKWNKVEVTIPDVSSDGISTLTIGVKSSNVSLNN